MTDIFAALSAPFPLDFIEWRIGSTNGDKTKGMALCYVDARAVMERLDSACGPDKWQCNYTPGVGGSIICNIGIEFAGNFIWKADGAGATDVEGDKGALSDAFKRAAVRWGVGRYLYDMKAPWVAIEPRGRSFFIPDHEVTKLNSIHEAFVRQSASKVAKTAVVFLSKKDAGPIYKELQTEMRHNKVEQDLKDWIAQTVIKDRIATMPPDFQQALRDDYAETLTLMREPV